jgi:MFS family permease
MGFVEQLAVSHQVYFYLDAGYEPMTAAAFYTVFGVCFALGNVGGALSDRIGRERFFIPACLACAGFASLYFVMNDASTPWLPPIIAAGFGTTFGSLCCVLNATLADLFQGRHYGKIAGSMILGFATGGTLSPWLAGHLHDVTGNYTATFAILVAGLLVTALLMALVAPRKLRPVARIR